MSKPESVQWLGTNFPIVYEWLMDTSISKSIVLRILEPGNPRSTIVISSDSFSLKLNVNDWIMKDNGTYYVSKNA